jgi:ABC-type spermidine/putrescine transport system permease subunit I
VTPPATALAVEARPHAAAGTMRRLRVTPFVLLAPALVTLLLFAAALFEFARASLVPFAPPGVIAAPGLTLASYVKVLTDPLYLGSLLLTLELSAIAAVASVLLGFSIAYWIVRTPSARVRAGLIVLVAVPFMTSLIVRLYALTLVLGNTGLVNRTLQAAGWIAENEFVPLIRNRLGVTLGLTYFVLPFVVFTLATIVRRLDATLEEAAQNLGADPVRTFLAVTLPLAIPGVLGAGSLAFALSVTAFATPLILGGTAVRMIAPMIYDQVLFVNNLPLGAALSMVALAVTLLVMYASARLTGGDPA